MNSGWISCIGAESGVPRTFPEHITRDGLRWLWQVQALGEITGILFPQDVKNGHIAGFQKIKKIYLSVWIIVFFLTGDRPGHRPKNPLLWWLWPRSRVRTDQSKSGPAKAQTWPGPLQKWSCGSFQCLWQDLYQHCSAWEVPRDATEKMIVLQEFTIFLGLLQGWPSLLSVIHSMSWYMWLKHELNMWHKIRLTFDIVSSMLWPNGTYYTSVSLADLHLKPVWSHTSWHDNLWLACCLTNILA